MKIIVSHDVDHLALVEHWRDRFYPGLWYKGIKGVLKQSLSPKEFLQRAFNFKLENIKELHEFNQKHKVQETFFFGMANALGLSYHYKKAGPYIDYLEKNGVDIGLHGIGYNSYEALLSETSKLFELLSAKRAIGIRNHYLRKTDNTLDFANRIGFTFDSTYNELKKPWKVGNLWEIPISVMDASILSPVGGKLTSAKEKSETLLQQALDLKLPYFVINFHDVYFSKQYSEYKDWYCWLINYLHSEKFEFISFSKALKELNKTNT